MPKLVALRSIYGDYKGGSATGVRAGLIHPGEVFEADDQQAESLETRGLAYRYYEPRVFTPKTVTIDEDKMLRAEAPQEKPKRRRTYSTK